MHRRAEKQPSKTPKVNGDETAVAMLKDTQLGCVRTQSRRSLHLSSTKVLRPIKRVKFTKATLSNANIREEKGPSLEKFCPVDPRERSPYAPKFEERSQEETERQEQCARGDAWSLAMGIYKLRKEKETTFFSPTEVWCLPARSETKPEER